MLVFSRKVGEKIAIGDGIEISVVRISPSTVRLGVVAPRECSVVRGELLHRGPPMVEIEIHEEAEEEESPQRSVR